MAGRFMAAGERLICLPRMGASYSPRGTLRSLWRQYLQYGEYRTKTAVRHPATMRRSHLLAPGLVITAAGATLGPRWIAVPARAGVAAYTVALTTTGVSSLRSGQDAREAALVPAALATMHTGHGVGMLRGVIRHGLPRAALLRVIGLRAAARRHLPPVEPTYAPSLS